MDYRASRLACYIGYVVQALVNNFLPLLFVMFNRDYNISYSKLGFLVLFNFSLQMLTDVLSIKAVAKTGTRIAITAAHISCGVGFILLSFLPKILPAFAGLLISTVFTAVGGGLIEVLVSPIIDRIPNEKNGSLMSLLHSFYCFGQIFVVAVTTLIIYFLSDKYWNLIALLWSVLPLFNAFMFSRVPLVEDLPPEKREPLSSLFRSRVFITVLILMITAGATELSVSQWASAFAEDGLNLPKMTGDILGPCAFALCMGIGRVLHSLLEKKVKLHTTLMFCSAFSVLCYLVMGLSENSIIAVLACALCGFGVSVLWPGVYSLAGRLFPKGGNAMFGILALGGDTGCLLGPWLVGLISSGAKMQTALIISIVFPMLSVAVLLINKRNIG